MGLHVEIVSKVFLNVSQIFITVGCYLTEEFQTYFCLSRLNSGCGVSYECTIGLLNFTSLIIISDNCSVNIIIFSGFVYTGLVI